MSPNHTTLTDWLIRTLAEMLPNSRPQSMCEITRMLPKFFFYKIGLKMGGFFLWKIGPNKGVFYQLVYREITKSRDPWSVVNWSKEHTVQDGWGRRAQNGDHAWRSYDIGIKLWFTDYFMSGAAAIIFSYSCIFFWNWCKKILWFMPLEMLDWWRLVQAIPFDSLKKEGLS